METLGCLSFLIQVIVALATIGIAWQATAYLRIFYDFPFLLGFITLAIPISFLFGYIIHKATESWTL